MISDRCLTITCCHVTSWWSLRNVDDDDDHEHDMLYFAMMMIKYIMTWCAWRSCEKVLTNLSGWSLLKLWHISWDMSCLRWWPCRWQASLAYGYLVKTRAACLAKTTSLSTFHVDVDVVGQHVLIYPRSMMRYRDIVVLLHCHVKHMRRCYQHAEDDDYVDIHALRYDFWQSKSYRHATWPSSHDARSWHPCASCSMMHCHLIIYDDMTEPRSPKILSWPSL